VRLHTANEPCKGKRNANYCTIKTEQYECLLGRDIDVCKEILVIDQLNAQIPALQ